MANELIHNKWHAFNHFTVPIEGFPDSGTDPIASKEYPFLGIFYNTLSGFTRDLGRSDSAHWWWYSSMTKAHSGWWSLHPYVLSTTATLSTFWSIGFNQGYTTLRSVSSKYNSYYITTLNLSGSEQYEGVGGINGPGGVGWHIALSATTHRLNEAQTNITQKVAKPVKLLEQGTSIIWDLSAQTVYVQLTGNYTLSATQVRNLKKGGKYTMWAYIDRCPEKDMKMVFSKDFYNITVKALSADKFFNTLTNVIRLSSSSITRIDFTCDGQKMLGKATQYTIWVPTEKDLYFKGLGLKMLDNNDRNKSPVYVNTNTVGGKILLGSPVELAPPYEQRAEGDWLAAGEGINIIENYLSNFTASSSLYVDGPPLSGIKFRYLTANTQYMNFVVYNAQWASSSQLSYSRDLTGSFDRIVGTLSGFGDFRDIRYANNLICSPGDETIVESIQSQALPTPPYELVSSNIREVTVCTSAYEVQIYSGKDRDIDGVVVNGEEVTVNPVLKNGIPQPFNELNERTCSIKFLRVQEDNTIEAFFKPQLPITLPNNLLWFNSNDSSLINKEAGPILDFYISWNLGTTQVTAYNPGQPVNQNEFDRPRINTFRGPDGSFVRYMSAGFEVLCGASKFYPWGDRLSGFDVLSIPVPGNTFAGVDFFTGTFLTAPTLTPPLANWTVTNTINPLERQYNYVMSSTDYRTPVTLVSIGVGATPPTWPVGSYPTIKTWETTSSTASIRPVTAFYSNILDNKKLFQYNTPNAPNLLDLGTIRCLELTDGKFMTLNTQLTTLSNFSYFKPFTTFTVISTTNTFSNSSIIWWMGDFFTPGNIKGFGLLLKSSNPTVSAELFNTANQQNRAGILLKNKLYIIATSYSPGGTNRVLLNNAGASNLRITRTDNVSSFNFVLGKNPQSNNMYCNGIRLFDFYMFQGDFSRGQLLNMNSYLEDKFGSFR